MALNTSQFDSDALLAALPKREVRRFGADIAFCLSTRKPVPHGSALFEEGAYNGFTERERYRTADLSKWLCDVGSTSRPAVCKICAAPADDEHAENYYDLSSWVGLCRRCHRSALHGRFQRPQSWFEVRDRHEVLEEHWSRLVSLHPFYLAALLRGRGWREPLKADFAPPAEDL